jgi:hypothetical protein
MRQCYNVAMEDKLPHRDPRAWPEPRAALARLCHALSAEDFSAAKADAAWEAWRSTWAVAWRAAPMASKRRSEGPDPALATQAPWPRLFDAGQCDNEHAKNSKGERLVGHPLLWACRWGSAESVAWACRQEGVEPVVRFEASAEAWCFARAAISGISGAFEPLWLLAKGLGWGPERRGEALSSWLVGAVEGPAERVGDSLGAARFALEELLAGNPDFWLPAAPFSVFEVALSSAMFHESPDQDEPSAQAPAKVLALLGFAPPSAWRHESQIPDTDAWCALHEEGKKIAETFAEDALCGDKPGALRALAAAGFEMPSLERAVSIMSSYGGSPDGEGMAALRAHWAGVERCRLDDAVGPGRDFRRKAL